MKLWEDELKQEMGMPSSENLTLQLCRETIRDATAQVFVKAHLSVMLWVREDTSWTIHSHGLVPSWSLLL